MVAFMQGPGAALTHTPDIVILGLEAPNVYTCIEVKTFDPTGPMLNTVLNAGRRSTDPPAVAEIVLPLNSPTIPSDRSLWSVSIGTHLPTTLPKPTRGATNRTV